MTSEVVSTHRSSQTKRAFPIKELGKRYLKEFQSDDLPGMGAEIAYHLIFAIPPILILVVTVAALLNSFTSIPVVEHLRAMVDQHAPGDLKAVFDSTITTAIAKANGGAVSVGAVVTALIALWSSSNAVTSLMNGLNRTFDVEEGRSFIRKKLLALGLTALFLVLFDAAFVLFVFGRQIGVWIADRVGLGTAFAVAWNILRWPVAIIFVMLLLALLFYLGPNMQQSFRWVSPGSIVATLLWVVVVFGFKLYLAISNPGSAYGAFGALVVLLFFLYVTGLIFLAGAELNAVLAKSYDEETIRFRAEHPEMLEDDAARIDARNLAVKYDEREGTKLSTVTPIPRVSATAPKAADVNELHEHRTGSTLVGGVTAVGVAGLIGWIVGRRGSRSG